MPPSWHFVYLLKLYRFPVCAVSSFFHIFILSYLLLLVKNFLFEKGKISGACGARLATLDISLCIYITLYINKTCKICISRHAKFAYLDMQNLRIKKFSTIFQHSFQQQKVEKMLKKIYTLTLKRTSAVNNAVQALAFCGYLNLLNITIRLIEPVPFYFIQF